MRKFAVIVAGGSGVRMGASVPKQFIQVNGKAILWYTIEAFLAAYEDMEIILVINEKFRKEGEAVVSTTSSPGRISTTGGGETRFQSVKNGLDLVENESIVFVHDAVRCLVTVDLIQRCYEGAIRNGSAIPAVPMHDTIRQQSGNQIKMIDRNSLRVIQTPQTFRSTELKNAFLQEYSDLFTDETAVMEQAGMEIHLVEGDEENIKITRPVDLVVAEAILRGRRIQNSEF